MDEGDNTAAEDNWDVLFSAIEYGKVSVVQTLLTEHPDLAEYRAYDVSPPLPDKCGYGLLMELVQWKLVFVMG
jgi:hypothetical protein